MEGVTILAVNEAVEAIRFNWVMAILIFSVAILVGLLQGIKDRMVGLGILLGGGTWFDFWNPYRSYYKSTCST